MRGITVWAYEMLVVQEYPREKYQMEQRTNKQT